jgi:hypothetical protein
MGRIITPERMKGLAKGLRKSNGEELRNLFSFKILLGQSNLEE